MWKITLVNYCGMEIDYFEIDNDEVTVDDIAERNWCLADGDSIRIERC